MTVDEHAPLAQPRFSILALIRAMRPRQWIKNLLVGAALVFDLRLDDPSQVVKTIAAFICFCLVSGGIYLVNDVLDRESDRIHPVKRTRPIASGLISPAVALSVAGLNFVVGLGIGIIIAPLFALLLLTYMVLMFGYALLLKHVVIIDVFVISAGFVLRAASGAVAIDVPISPWLYVCTVLLALFLGFGKRRAELQLLTHSASEHRRNLDDYTVGFLDQLLIITAAATVMAYSLYTFTASTLPDDHVMMITIPIVLYGLFRYLFLVYSRDDGGAPEQLLLTDVPLLSSVVLWGVTVVAVLYFGT